MSDLVTWALILSSVRMNPLSKPIMSCPCRHGVVHHTSVVAPFTTKINYRLGTPQKRFRCFWKMKTFSKTLDKGDMNQERVLWTRIVFEKEGWFWAMVAIFFLKTTRTYAASHTLSSNHITTKWDGAQLLVLFTLPWDTS
jgi:hypothetical protein